MRTNQRYMIALVLQKNVCMNRVAVGEIKALIRALGMMRVEAESICRTIDLVEFETCSHEEHRLETIHDSLKESFEIIPVMDTPLLFDLMTDVVLGYTEALTRRLSDPLDKINRHDFCNKAAGVLMDSIYGRGNGLFKPSKRFRRCLEDLYGTPRKKELYGVTVGYDAEGIAERVAEAYADYSIFTHLYTAENLERESGHDDEMDDYERANSGDVSGVNADDHWADILEVKGEQ